MHIISRRDVYIDWEDNIKVGLKKSGV